MSYEDMKKVVEQGYTCGVCGAPLTLAWGKGIGYPGWILRCRNLEHGTMTKHDRKMDEHYRIVRGEEKRMPPWKNLIPSASKTLLLGSPGLPKM